MAKSTAKNLVVADDQALDALQWSEERLAAFSCFYDVKDDVLFAHENPNPPAVSLPVGREAWLRYDPATLQVVGMEIEDYEKRFLPSHPEFQGKWRAIRPSIAYRPGSSAAWEHHSRTADAEQLARYRLALLHQVLVWYSEAVDAKARA